MKYFLRILNITNIVAMGKFEVVEKTYISRNYAQKEITKFFSY